MHSTLQSQGSTSGPGEGEVTMSVNVFSEDRLWLLRCNISHNAADFLPRWPWPRQRETGWKCIQLHIYTLTDHILQKNKTGIYCQNDMAIFSFNSFWPILRYTCIFFTLLRRTSSLSCTRMMLNHILKAHWQIQAYNDFTFTGKNKKTT